MRIVHTTMLLHQLKINLHFKVNTIPLDFLASEEATIDFLSLIAEKTSCREQQNDIDNVNNKSENVIKEEMK